MAQKFCTECGAGISGDSPFCAKCGTPLISAKRQSPAAESSPAPAGPAVPIVSFPPAGPGVPMKMGKMSPVDESLTMLAEYCTKTVATVGGDGYTEWVLNRRTDGALQLDYFRNYVGYEKEVHATSPAPADTWDKILAVKKKYHVSNPPAWLAPGTCGGEQIVKIMDGDTVIRLVYGSLGEESSKAFALIRDILTGLGPKTY